MSLRRLLPALWLAALASLRPPASVAATCDLVITHVNVVPMTSPAILRDRTVLVEGGRIAAIVKPTAKTARGCAVRRDGRGQYLVPGLNDLHVHLDSQAVSQALGASRPPIDYPAALAPYLANGVTGVRVMSGAPDILAFRDSQDPRTSAMPRLVVASPMLSGAPPVIPEPITRVVTTPEAARQAVEAYAAAGYDLIKVRDNLKAPVLRAVIEAAREKGLYVDGHLSRGQGLGLAEVLAAGQKGVAHLDNLALTLKSPADAATYARLLSACGCFVTTTLEVEANAVRQLTSYDQLIAAPGVKHVPALILRSFWAKPNNPLLAGKTQPDFFRKLLETDGLLLRTFQAAGVHLVAGTDALNPMILPGESLHDELEDMVAVGLTPYQALRTATANPAAYVPGFSEVGLLAPGRAATALLVAGDPLRDLATLRTPTAVMVNGHWLSAADLARRLQNADGADATR